MNAQQRVARNITMRDEVVRCIMGVVLDIMQKRIYSSISSFVKNQSSNEISQTFAKIMSKTKMALESDMSNYDASQSKWIGKLATAAVQKLAASRPEFVNFWCAISDKDPLVKMSWCRILKTYSLPTGEKSTSW